MTEQYIGRNVWRCYVTGHPVGTDTETIGNPCRCQGCRAGARIAELEAENAQHVEEIGRLHADILKLRGWEATPDGMKEVMPNQSDEIDRLLRGIRVALDYLNEARDGDASFNLEALLAGSDYELRNPDPP